MPKAAFQTGRTSWPAVVLDEAVFARWIEDKQLAPEAVREHAADIYIACACLARTPGAADAFSARYLANVRPYLGSLTKGRDHDFICEVGQHLSEKLLVGTAEQPPRLSAYGARGPLEGWIRMAAMRAALDLMRREHPERHGDEALVEQAVGHVDGELAYLKERYRPHFVEAFREALGSISAQSRALLRLHYLEHVTTAALAALHGVSRPTIVRRLTDAREEVLVAVGTRVRDKLAVDASEYDSLLELVRSQIDMSLTGMLRGLDAP
jgi:RNA polymerase sigma-70 factor (ECF subfamily)